jgi:hypothetical protein
MICIQIFYQLFYLHWPTIIKLVFTNLSPGVARLEPSNLGSLIFSSTNCPTNKYRLPTTYPTSVKLTFLSIDIFFLVPVVAGLEPFNLGLRVNCSTSCPTTTVLQYSNIPFSLSAIFFVCAVVTRFKNSFN